MSKTIKTDAASQRRTLRFETIDECRAEVDRIVAAAAAGTVRQSGNWTAGQTFGHLAAWINYAYDGYPFKTPWFIRMILKLRVKRYLRKGLPEGVRIPGVKEGTYAIQDLSIEEGANQLRSALTRLGSPEPAPYDSPAFGKLTNKDRIVLNLRHAELHLGFLHP